jgi:uncharacterized Zn finger protein
MYNVTKESSDITLRNFKRFVDEKHYGPGRSLYHHKKVKLTEEENGNWIAQVEDGMHYQVFVRIMDGYHIVRCECGCASERILCRHSVAVLCTIANQLGVNRKY